MHLPQDAIFLRAFIGEADRADGHALYRAIVEAARAAGLAGATVLHGPLSFGPNRRINSEFLVEAPGNLPMVVEIVDTEDRIHAFLPRLEQLVGSGLVTSGGPPHVPLRPTDPRACRASDVTFNFQVARALGRTSTEVDKLQAGRTQKMDVPHEAILLRIFTSADDRYGVEEPLYRAIVMKAREVHLAGATVLQGPLGFGHSSRLHKPHFLATDERPVVIEICDSEEKINAFLPVLDEMMESGLVTLEKARVLQYGRTRSDYLKRLKESVLQHLHIHQTSSAAR